MLYLVYWYGEPEVIPEVYKRFKKTGHNAPAGVKILNAVFTLHQHAGWAIAEANDPVDIGKWLHNWSDLCEHEVYPVVDEEGLKAIIGD